MADRREEKERLRQIRLEAERREASEQRRKLLAGYLVAGVLGLAVLVGIVVVVLSSGGGDGASGQARILQASGDTNGLTPDTREGTEPPPLKDPDLSDAAKAAGCVLREDLPNEGANHLPPGSPMPDYKTAPPTSGDHIQPPLQQADGAYLDEPSPLNFIHSMEHGRLLIMYQPDLPEADQLELRGLYDTMYSGALLFPYSEMPYAVAATTWTNLIGCKKYEGGKTIDTIRDFGVEHWGTAPEGVDFFGPLDGPTPVEPSDASSSDS